MNDIDLIPCFSFSYSSKVAAYGHSLETLSFIINQTLKMSLITAIFMQNHAGGDNQVKDTGAVHAAIL